MTDTLFPHRDCPQRPTGSVVVLGARGRVGSAVVQELTDRGRAVTAIMRAGADPFVDAPLVRSRTADVRDLAAVADELAGASAAVVAVSPFTRPPETFDGFEEAYYAGIVAEVDRRLAAGSRMIMIGLTATVRLSDGSIFVDHAELFPARLRPFVRAHQQGQRALAATRLDWATLIPAAGLDSAAPGLTPALVCEPVPLDRALSRLGHRTLARAVADQIEQPTLHRDRALVVEGPAE